MQIPQLFPFAKAGRFAFRSFKFHASRRLVALALATQMMFIPAPVAASAAISDAIRGSSVATAKTWDGLLGWLKRSSSQTPANRGVKPPPPEQNWVARSIWQSRNNPSLAIFMMVGAWFLGSTAMMIGASFSGGGFATGILDTVGVIILGLLPPYTMILSAYDGSLLSVLIATFLALGAHFQFEADHWILPPDLRNRMKRWYENRLAKDF